MHHPIQSGEGSELCSTHIIALQNQTPETLCAEPSILGQINNLSHEHENKDMFLPCAPSSPRDNCGIVKEDVALPLKGVQAVYPLDDSIQANDLAFFKKATGINDASEFINHIMGIRESAYKSFPYPCIWGFEFLKGKTTTHPFYRHMKENTLSNEHQKFFIDLGTFLGVDLRQVVEDGWNSDNVLGVDILPEWRDLGHQLFRDGNEALPFYLGDILQVKTLNDNPSSEARPVLDLRNLQDLNQLKGRVSFISANQLFHLFSKDDQKELAERCGRLLSHEPGAAIFGTQLGFPEEKLENYKLHLHSPESWEQMWKEVLGEKIQVIVKLEEADAQHPYHSCSQVESLYWLYWSVART
ncbi:uncharacterized protein PGTG_07945 [Puccinia graminis f. sp. tritici CRL 75-36-700-3]|uniref:Methyltransferase type 11 domain-containing protein n=1 Tax=Puccinia graminis f. sp. tritici (strain CRL 75-36-700-3 / race SCCL) TaxID=418459 RepID=E3KBL4_PUCGT|nr:uncharacterized protein PGTG_07945 [Puccinia graminis f. sp. tritici CRL 75-36-700-3]EFP81696.2 hypothetical protein PGTG_07945 [Puccinia graminis f. sp. tritici CRL 75-36-700-3]